MFRPSAVHEGEGRVTGKNDPLTDAAEFALEFHIRPITVNTREGVRHTKFQQAKRPRRRLNQADLALG